MHKYSKHSKKGFTLTEMVLVIAIIVILASVVAIAVGTYLSSARRSSANVDGQVETLKNSVNDRAGDLISYGF